MNAQLKRLKNRSRFSALWIVIAIFASRIYGQIIAASYHPAWLPPMHEWYSGLVPWPLLLPIQLLILTAMVVLTVLASGMAGACLIIPQRWRRVIRIFAVLYLASMVVRFIVHVTLNPGGYRLTGAIPIFTHWALAGFLLRLDSMTARNSPSGCQGSTTLFNFIQALLSRGSVRVRYLLSKQTGESR